MPVRLRPEEIVTIRVLNEKGTPKREIARQLGVSEGLVRYHVKRGLEGAVDGRSNRSFEAEVLRPQVAAFFTARSADARPANIRVLHEHLVQTVRYAGGEAAYRRLLRFVRAEFPRPKMRTYRRVETPPGAQTQTDWGEFPRVRLGGAIEPLHGFFMTLSHSRKPALVWSRGESMVHWLSCHNAAYRRLGGVAAVNRIDNLKTGVVSGAGATAKIHPVYLSYARSMRFHVDPCPPRQGWAKGKVEAKVRLGRIVKDLVGAGHANVDALQRDTDGALSDWADRAICPITGTPVNEAWESERPRLGCLPDHLPEPFDVAVERPVQKDCTVHFEGRRYTVPFSLAGKRVEVRGCAEVVQVVHGDAVVVEWPRGTKERLLIDTALYEGEATEHVTPPPPLGRMGRRLQEIWDMPVEKRPIDLYAALWEVAR